MTPRLAIVSSHPVQYYAPWFRFIAQTGRVNLKVFYLWTGASQEQHDPGFGLSFRWDVPLLDGYVSEFVPNVSRQPGPGRFFGLRNPSLKARLAEFAPDAALLIGYNAWSFLRMIFSPPLGRPPYPLLFRGDSHRLSPRLDSPSERIRRALITAVYHRFAGVLYVGQANREYFRWHDVPEERLFFSPHAVDNARFAATPAGTGNEAQSWRRTLGIADERLLIIFAGKFEEKKRPQDLLAAFRKLDPAVSASLLFVGAGQLEAALRAQAAGNPHIHFAPFQNQSQMPRTYAAADLFVLPSYGREETWGLAINEALCLGCPVIVSDQVGCAADLVQSGRNGLVFPAGDVDGLVGALREALSDRARLGRWGEEGRRVVERYNYANASEGLFEAMAALPRTS